ncbi:MAG: hypothetical protein GX494_01765 [Clostridiaceae bacterium]|nr:hypothetical protein [Clostridiaceae bacterium]
MRLRGSITVFMSIILSALIAFTGIIVDASRLKIAKKHAQAAVQLSVQSALTQYHAPLKEHYGLMSMGCGQEELEAFILELLENNLAVENAYLPGLVDLYGFQVKNVTVTPFFNLTEDYVLEQQITQFMKYRAPAVAIGNFLEKLKALKTCMAQSGVLNKKMDLEKKLQKIREEQVYLHLLLAERIRGFSEGGELPQNLQNHLNIIPGLANDIQTLEKPGSELDTSWDSMIKIAENISNVENDIRRLQREADDLEREIAGYETSEEEGADDYINSLTDRLSAINNEISLQKAYIRDEKDLFKKNADVCLGILRQIEDKAKAVYSNVSTISDVVERFIDYHNEAAGLADEIAKGCEAAEKIRVEIEDQIKIQSAESDNAFLMRIKTEVNKLVINADPDVIHNISAEIEHNLAVLKDTKSKMDEYETSLRQVIDEIHSFIRNTEDGTARESVHFERETFGSRINHMSEPIGNVLKTAAAAYKKPAYTIEPAVNGKEKNEFKKWCNTVFNEENDVDNSRDKGYQKKLKQNIRKNEEENSKEEEQFNGDDTRLSNKKLDEIFQKLPSYRDKEGRYVNVKNSDYISEEPEDDYQPSAGVNDNTDVEEKYGSALNENGNLASRIEKLMASAGEALIRVLYVNEYIVSAFKNANLENIKNTGISLAGFPKESFFEKGEVEYIIFGAKKEKTNVLLAKSSIFGIRMGLNLIHIYTDTEKTAAALTAANIIAGWSAFGVPVVKNLILIGWAAGESWLDVKGIDKGEPVPVYKTKNTWKLDLKSMFSGIAEEIINETTDWLKQTKNELIDEGEDALRTAVESIVYSAVNEAFLPVEQMYAELDKGDNSDTEPVISGIDIPNDFGDMQALKEWIIKAAKDHFESVKSEAVNWSVLKIEEYKKNLTKKIADFIFESSAYKNFVSRLKGKLDDIINHGGGLLADKADELGGKIGDTGVKEQVLGSVISFDYLDYLRLLLFVVPQKTKLLRIADLMQLNMQKTLNNPEFVLSGYNTFLLVEAEISFKYLFIPKNLVNRDEGQIKIQWGYGY